ncbi:T9SS type A sorting domain-containing protein [Flavobacterium sp. LMO9]|uniref:T9SS type A sorting domain-containing protein n=1 Tax=Flavobacterium sp. LMO9 TaxID=2654245 RepID=UPI0012923CCB|nr:T9SS type A sorting domain-containing protein [Flavobacterium sp. LMO9]MQP53311.1 T9SS type A sorting domain-containing protein [Flavobacterium sp. LMO9]
MKTRLLFYFLLFQLSVFSQCWNQISAGYEHSAGIKSDGTLWTWGKNTNGQLGDGTLVNKPNPTQIGTDADWTMVSASYSHTVALKSNGTMWSWGTSSGQVANFSSTLLVPTQIGTDADWTYINTSSNLTFAIKSNGELWTWGSDNYGRIGRVNNAALPAKVITTGGQIWVEAGGSATHSVGLKSDGTIWAWGNGADGRLGNSSFTSQVIPVQVGTDTNWKSIKAGADYSIAVKTTGTLWAWGKNDLGQLGTGSLASPIIYPVQIGSLATWDKISAGDNHNLGIKTDGSLWSWGSNGFGQLGTNNTVMYTFPIQVGVLYNWTNVEAGFLHSSALNNYGIGSDWAWTWGNNGSGRLGNSNINTLIPNTINCPLTIVTPVFNQIAAQCSGATFVLPTISTNGITGTWSPAINNSATTTYTFTPTAGQNATTTSMTIEVNNPITPTGNAVQNFTITLLHNKTLSDIVVYPSNVVWYPSIRNAISGTNPLPNNTPLVSRNTYYAVNVIGTCRSAPFAVTVNITNFSNRNKMGINSDINVFPNPVNDVLNIETVLDIQSVEIYNIQGQKVLSSNQKQINVSDLAAGMYMVRIQDADNNIATKKIVIN